MRRIGYVIEEITQRENMENSFDVVLHGTKRKRSKQGRYLLAHREKVIEELTNSIAKGEYKVSGYHNLNIVEGGKDRIIQIIPMKDRIAVHAIMHIVDKHLRRIFIRTTGASIKKRGMHDLMKYIRRDIANDPVGTQYCYKLDIKKFYDSVDQDLLMEVVSRTFQDKKLVTILDGFVRMMPKGISIGLRSSQGLGNLFLSDHLDHHFKDKMGLPYYYRYCDDIVVLSSSKRYLWKIRAIVHKKTKRIKLRVKDDERVFPSGKGIDYLGYVIYPDHVKLRKRIKVNFARSMHEIKSSRRRCELVASFYGMAKHANCIMLFKKLTGKDMKNFKDLNVSYKPDDGKKRFQGSMVSIRELVNLPIVVKDYELGITTEQGDDRCLVSIEQDGEPKKFFTNSQEMKNILEQVSAVEGGFPFSCVIKAEAYGKGKTKYIFT